MVTTNVGSVCDAPIASGVVAIDLFGGGGGSTTGAKKAGWQVEWAGNHCKWAVETHTRNHPDVEHSQEDLHRTNWPKVARATRPDVIIASPACQGFSRARGKVAPGHEAKRATAWCVVAAVEAALPQAFVVENVKEFLGWALFPAWQEAFRALGYHLTTQLLNAADFGVPQSRERLFVVGHRRAPLHLVSPGLPHVPAKDIIQWTGHPKARRIEDRRQPFAPRTAARIEHGKRVYGDRFLVPYYSGEKGARDPEKPIGTLTTKPHYGVFSHGTYRMIDVPEMLATQSFPENYWVPNNLVIATELIGNAVPPEMARGVFVQVGASLA